MNFFRQSEIPEHLQRFFEPAEIGLEATPDAFVATMVEVFRECRRVLKDDGTLWLNLGDSYHAYNGNRGPANGANKNHHAVMPSLPTGHGLTSTAVKPKDLLGIPWRVAFALQADGWYLRQDIIWSKPNPMPESVTDRCTKAHEYIFLLSKSQRYYFDQEAIAEESITLDARAPYAPAHSLPTSIGHVRPAIKMGMRRNGDDFTTRNRRSVWTVTTKPYSEAHFATFPPDLITPCILAGCPEDGVVCDPFAGSGTTLAEAKRLGRRAVGSELNPSYCEIAIRRIEAVAPTPLFDAIETPETQVEMFGESEI